MFFAKIFIIIILVFKGNEFIKIFEKDKEDKDGIRDSLVIMKNPLVLRGLFLFVFSFFILGNYSNSIFIISPIYLVVAFSLIFFYPKKMLIELKEKENTDKEIELLKKAFFFYHIAVSVAFI